MGRAITVGPLLIAVDRGLAVLCTVAFLALAAFAERRGAARVSAVATSAVVAGLVAGRIGYVALRWSSYRDDPWSALAIWQGGFSPVAGIVGAAILLAVRLGLTRALVPAFGALAVPSLLWIALQAWIPPVNYGPFPYHTKLAAIDGTSLDLQKLRGRPFVVNLWATWCGPCRRELPMLVGATNRKDSVPILLANQGEDGAVVAAFMAREKLGESSVALDHDRSLSRALAIAGYPATAFVAADGTIVQFQLGEISRAALADGIDIARNHR